MDGEHARPRALLTEPSLFPAAWQRPLLSHSPFGERWKRAKASIVPAPQSRCRAALRGDGDVGRKLSKMGEVGGGLVSEQRKERGSCSGPAEAARVAGALRQAGLAFGHRARVAAAAPGQMFRHFSLFGSQRLLLPSAWPPSPALRGWQIPLPPSPTGPRIIHVGGEMPGSPLKPPRVS